jgi:hypothetical protein
METPSMKKSAVPLALAIAALVPMHLPADAIAQRAPIVADAASAQTAAPLSPKQRGELARQFVLRWGDHVERVYDVRVGVWARRMVPTFAAADPANFRNAMKRATFEGAVAELMGLGFRLGDQRAVQRLAEASRTATGARNVADKALGDLDRDLTYTPIQPCRILDTRSTVAGPIAAGATRSFVAVAGTYASQGGDAGDCGTTGVVPSAVALNVTAVTPDRAGYATVFPFGAAQPLASSVNYTAGAIVNNAIITKVPNPLLASDFTIFSFGQSHYVVDIVGYFAPNKATPLDCTLAFSAQSDIANDASFFLFAPACPAGYTMISNGCRINTGSGRIDWSTAGLATDALGSAYCGGINRSGGVVSIGAVTRCCRVPGR